MKKVLHISRTMGQGGAEKVVYQICKDSKNIEMFVASCGGVYEESLAKLGVKHYYIPDIDSKNPITMLKIYMGLRKIIKNENIDIIHSHHRMAAFYSRILCIFNRKIKRIYTAHNVFYNKKSLLRYALKDSEIIAVGNGVKSNLINYYGINPNCVKVIYNSIEELKEINILNDEIIKEKNNKILIGTIGRLSEQKGIDIFLSSISELIYGNRNIVAVIIGDGELRTNLEEQCDKLNIKENVKFLGYRSDVLELISQMDFIVLASRWEGFPLTPIETFSMGKTIIASNIDGNNEIVKDGYNGLLCEKDNINDFREKINELINNKELKKNLEINAKETFESNFSYKSFIDSYMKVYDNM